MKRLLVAAALAPLTFAAQAHADTPVSSATTTPLATSTAGNVTINSGGSIKPSAGGTSSAPVAAVTIDSSNTVSNAGTISYTTLDYATGILASGAFTSSISNTGTISLTETTNYKDTNNDGIVDSNGSVAGQFATGTNRFGIQTKGGQFAGGIDNSVTISVIGENSAGILIGAGGINGALTNTGTISVTGGNPGTSDVSYGINAQGAVGSAKLGGTISALGHNAVGVNIGGGTLTNGAVEINATVTATGYRSTTAPTSPSILALVKNQAADELLQGGPAVAIGGSVAGGISLDAPVTASGSQVAVAGAAITSYGRAPALLIGSGSSAMTVGPYAAAPTAGYGLVLGGTITGAGIYDVDGSLKPVGANAVQIGVGYVDSVSGIYNSTNSQAVSIAGGLDITGSIAARGISSTVDSTVLIDGKAYGGSVTALHLGDVLITSAVSTGAIPSALNVVGTVSASSTSTVPVNVTAIHIDAGASVGSLYNRGSILASVTGIPAVLNQAAVGGTSGNAMAIVDKSGSLTSVTNSATINAAITPIDPTQFVVPGSRTIAIDLSANTTAATVTQVTDSALTGTDAAGKTTILSPTIVGDVLFGSGNGMLNLQSGTLVGGMLFGAGPNNAIIINGGATAVGQLAEDQNGKLAIDIVNGALDITSPVTNSTHTLGQTAAFNTTQGQGVIGISSLHVFSGGELTLTVNPAVTAAQLDARGSGPGSIIFDDGSKLGLNFTSKLKAPGATPFILIEADPNGIALGKVVTGNSGLGDVPFLYNVSIATGDASNSTLVATVSKKSASDLGLNPAEASAYGAIYTAFDAPDPKQVGTGSISNALLGADSRSKFIKLYDQFLPDYSGGPFEDMVLGQQALARAEADNPDKLETDSTRGWVQEIAYYNSRSDSSSVNGYTGKGFGLAGGVEKASGRSAIGLAASLVSSSVHDLARPDGSSLGAAAVEVGAYWRTGGDGLNLAASVNGGYAFMESRRILMEQSGTDAATLYRLAKANWMGGVGSASLSASYKENFGRYYIKPEALADYVLFYEQGYHEHGGGDAFNLTINSKLNQEAIVQGDVVFGASYGSSTRWSPELTVGWRQIVAGGPANTTASFAGGVPFKLSPDYTDKGGLMARIGLRASGNFADFNASAGGVFRTGYDSYDARAAARFLF